MEDVKNRSSISRISFSRDHPPGCGISNSSFKGFSLINLYYRYVRDFPPGCGLDAPPKTEIPLKKLKGSAKNTGFSNDSSTWRRLVTAVKSKSLVGDEVAMRNTKNLKRNEPVLNNPKDRRESRERDKVLDMLELFRDRCNQISMSGKGIRRVDTTAYSELKSGGKIMNRSALMFGSVPGVEIGDKFHYRIELLIVGLHKQTQGGIDSMEWGGSRVATSIVANERHLDKMNDPHALVYIGEGGNLKRNEVGVPPDQELKAGNRALWNSMEGKKTVRVIRGLSYGRNFGQKILYVYDGLYEVRDCVRKKGTQGNMIFEFQLTWSSGQPAVPWQDCRRYQF